MIARRQLCVPRHADARRTIGSGATTCSKRCGGNFGDVEISGASQRAACVLATAARRPRRGDGRGARPAGAGRRRIRWMRDRVHQTGAGRADAARADAGLCGAVAEADRAGHRPAFRRGGRCAGWARDRSGRPAGAPVAGVSARLRLPRLRRRKPAPRNRQQPALSAPAPHRAAIARCDEAQGPSKSMPVVTGLYRYPIKGLEPAAGRDGAGGGRQAVSVRPRVRAGAAGRGGDRGGAEMGQEGPVRDADAR